MRQTRVKRKWQPIQTFNVIDNKLSMMPGFCYTLYTRDSQPLGRGPLPGLEPFRTRPWKWRVSACVHTHPHLREKWEITLHLCRTVPSPPPPPVRKPRKIGELCWILLICLLLIFLDFSFPSARFPFSNVVPYLFLKLLVHILFRCVFQLCFLELHLIKYLWLQCKFYFENFQSILMYFFPILFWIFVLTSPPCRLSCSSFVMVFPTCIVTWFHILTVFICKRVYTNLNRQFLRGLHKQPHMESPWRDG